jgi:hypothetical protein
LSKEKLALDMSKDEFLSKEKLTLNMFKYDFENVCQKKIFTKFMNLMEK